jgi:hypothetical protein
MPMQSFRLLQTRIDQQTEIYQHKLSRPGNVFKLSRRGTCLTHQSIIDLFAN